MSDDSTLSAHWAAQRGVGTYNGGEVFGDGCWPEIRALIHRLGLKDGLVVYQHTERRPLPGNVGGVSFGVGGVTQRLLPFDSKSYQVLRVADRLRRDLLRYSPLEIWLTHRIQGFSDDVWLPNVAARSVVARRLKNGRTFLFFPDEVRNSHFERPIDVKFFTELRDLVRSTGNDLVVILVPDKFDVYRLLLEDPVGEKAGAKPYLARVAEVLRSAQVRVIDLAPVLRQQADEMLSRGEYNYHSDDTHWNEAGVARATRFVLESGLETSRTNYRE